MPGTLRLRLLATAYTLVLLALTLYPTGDVSGTLQDTWGLDKVEHVLAYALLAGLWVHALPGHRGLVVAAVLAFGVGTEYLQGALPVGRSFNPYDMLANGLGVLAGLAFAARFRTTAS